MPEADPFGSRYYGRGDTQAARRPGKRPDTYEEVRLRTLLDASVLDRVKSTVKQWNQTIRELIRAETGARIRATYHGVVVSKNNCRYQHPGARKFRLE